MELQDVIKSRTSIRKFKEDAISLEDVKKMVELAAHAPSINNTQPWKFYIIRNKVLINEMAEAVSDAVRKLPQNESRLAPNIIAQVEFFSTFFKGAPTVVALAVESHETIMEKGTTLSHNEINKMRNYPNLQATGACMQNLLLSAVDMGYGACWMSGPMIAAKKLQEMLSIDEPYHLMAFVALGKPAVSPRPKTRKPLDEIIEVFE